MSNSKRISTSPPSPPQPDLKTRVLTCLTKLSDRDTLAVATSHLESLATNLTSDSLPSFISYVSSTSSSDKPNVRKQCVRILSLLAVTHSNNLLLPHVSKIMVFIIKRLKDPESSVRCACVDAVKIIVTEVDDVDIMLVVKMLLETVMTEQDQNSQIGAALCLSAAIEAYKDVEVKEIVKFLPRVLKMLKSEFKGKSALLGVVGSIVGVGGGSCGVGMSRSLVNAVVECLVGFLSSEDWGCRKASVVALGRLAVVENVDLSEVRASCVTCLENKRFDKVKVVRESMNQTLELWKEIPGKLDEVTVLPQSNGNTSSKDNSIGKSPARRPNAPHATAMETPPKETISNSKHSPIQRASSTTPQSKSPPKSNYRKHSALIARKVDFDKETDLKANAPVPKPILVEGNCKEKRTSEIMVDNDKAIILETEKRVTEQAVANKTRDGSFGKLGGSRFGARVVPFVDDCELEMDIKDNAPEYVYGNQKEVEDIYWIQKQLVQIENQQSNLLNLLQKFMGSSRSGMNSLETRVNGLEKALDEISYDLAISTGRVSNSDSCCMGTEFLSPKYWKTEGSFHSPRSPFRGSQQSLSDRCLPNKDFNLDSPTRGIAPKTPGGGYGNLGRSSESLLSARNKKVTQGQNCNFDIFDGGSLASYIPQRN